MLIECSKINETSSFQLGMILPHRCLEAFETFLIVTAEGGNATGEAVVWRGHGFCQTAYHAQDGLCTPATRSHLAPNVNSAEAEKPWTQLNRRLRGVPEKWAERGRVLWVDWKHILLSEGLSHTTKWSRPEDKGQYFRGCENRCLNMRGIGLFTLPGGSVSKELWFPCTVPAVKGRSGWETRLGQRLLPTLS